MIDRPLADIRPDDLQRLQVNGVAESRSLDYKESLPVEGDDRREFLADVSSFANSSGGDLVYGVTEVRENGRPTGIPQAVNGLANVNPDAETLRLENMLRDGIAPRLPGVQLRWVPGLAQGPVLIIRVPRSWSGPHMVTFRQHSRFYARNAGGKYALDVFEIRHAFLNSGSLSERARETRAERLGRVLAGETPETLVDGGPLVCVHVIPHAALAGAVAVDLSLASRQGENLFPINSGPRLNWTFNIDGFVAFCPTETGPVPAYLQLYRNGLIETVTSTMIRPMTEGGPPVLPSLGFANQLNAVVKRAKRLMTSLSVEPPASLFVSLLGVRSAMLGIDFGRMGHYPKPFGRDNVLFREILLTDWDGDDAYVILKPLLDEVWQGAGFERCHDYNERGVFTPTR